MLNELPQKLLSKDKKLNAKIQKAHIIQKKRSYANNMLGLMAKAEPGFLEAEDGQQTFNIKQKQLTDLVNIQSASYQFSLDLPFGDYRAHYTRNGSSLLLTSSMGHVAMMDWRSKDLLLEIHLKDKIRQARFLHSSELFALAQKNHLYIYDDHGVEIHKLPISLGIEYLPYHFLLASYCSNGLTYYDTSTGNIVAQHHSRQPYTTISQNASNAVIALGTAKGTVEWWCPATGRPAVQIFAGAAVSSISFHREYMVTASENVKVWDTRMMKVVHSYPTHKKTNGLTISATGILAINYGHETQFYKGGITQHQSKPYMKHASAKSINNMEFIPFEDVMGLGLSQGFCSILIPGSGDPNYDTFEINPFETLKQRRQGLVHKLLEKLPPETISVDPNLIGTVDAASEEVKEKERKQEEERLYAEKMANKKKKNKTKGRNTIINKLNNKARAAEIERRRKIGETMNLKILARRAEKAKKKTEQEVLEELDDVHFDPLQILRKKQIHK